MKLKIQYLLLFFSAFIWTSSPVRSQPFNYENEAKQFTANLDSKDLSELSPIAAKKDDPENIDLPPAFTEAISLEDFIEDSQHESSTIALQSAKPMAPEIIDSPLFFDWSNDILGTDYLAAESLGVDEIRVDQLRDVYPTDWAFSALQNLIDRYDCITGYPDGTFRGDRALSRYEFAAGLNACLQRMEILFGETLSDKVTREEFESLQRLLQEFERELAATKIQTDNLEARTHFLEDNVFSTTVIFGGEAIMALAVGTGGDPPGTGVAEPIFGYTSKMGIVGTFTGRDRFRLSFSSGNFNDLAFAGPDSLNTRTALMSFQNGTDNDIILDSIEYRTAAFGDRVVFTIKPVGFKLSDVLTANSAYFDSGRGAISRFAEASPVFKIGAPEAGIGFDWLLSNRSRLQVAYGIRGGNTEGWFGADQSVLGVQLLSQPVPNVITGLTYVNGYSRNGRLDTFTGSFNADTSGQFFSATPVQIHAINGSVQWRIAPKVTLGAWGGLIYSRGLGLDETAAALTKTYLFSLGIADPFGREGDLFAILAGQPPKLFLGTGPVPEDPASSLHFEMFYNFRVTDNISITPGFFLVTNPGNVPNNNTIFVGAIRTTLRF